MSPEKPMSKPLIPVVAFIDGIVCIIVALFAYEIGLDTTTTWGISRSLLFFCGLVVTTFSIFMFFSKGVKGMLIDRLQKSQFINTAVILGHLWLIIFSIYIWFVTFGNFTTWTHTTHYYTRLSDAFLNGHLNLDINPGSLANAANPYDPENRPHFNDDVWDMSYYDGKLYMYWGPVPSLIIAPIQAYFNLKIADSHLVFIFFAGLLIVNSLIIIKLWQKYYPSVSAWKVYFCILLTGLILPVLWQMNVPNVYEVAVGAGQFFLMGGIYFSISAFEGKPSDIAGKLFMAGLFWAASVGSRAINVFAVIFLTLAISWLIIKKQARPIAWINITWSLAPLYLVLLLGAFVIGWYNWARFGSPFEFGLRYQITTYDLYAQSGKIFRLEYFPLNFYAYFLHPFSIISEFPFFRPTVLSSLAIQNGIEGLDLYYAGRTTGILFSMPFLFLGFIALPFMRNVAGKTIPLVGTNSIKRVIFLLSGSSLIGFTSLLFYFNAQERFLVDVISPVTILSIIGYWELILARDRLRSLLPRVRVVFWDIFLLLTIVVGFLLSITSETNRLETLNPGLFESIVSFLKCP